MSVNNLKLKHDYAESLSQPLYIPFELSSDGSERVCYYSSTNRQSLKVALYKLPLHRISIGAEDGFVYLTTKRLVYVTATSGDVDSFLIDLMLASILRFSHSIKSPWFGPNYWEFMFFSDAGVGIASDGLPKNEYFQGTIHFNNGGLFDFVAHFNQVITDASSNTEIDEQLPRYQS